MMKNFKWNFFIVLAAFILLISITTWAQNPAAPGQLKAGLKVVRSNLTSNPNDNLTSRSNIEDIVEKVYKKNHECSDKILINAQWFVSAAITGIGVFLGLIGYLSYRSVVVRAEIEIASIKNKTKDASKTLKSEVGKANNLNLKLTEAIKNLKSKLDEAEQAKKDLITRLDETTKIFSDTIAAIEKDVNMKIKGAQMSAYYDMAIPAIDKKRYEFALDLLLVLLKSNYRLREVCYHIGVCYKNLVQPDYPLALQFFEQAKVEAENSGKEGMAATIQREIDEIRALMQAAPGS